MSADGSDLATLTELQRSLGLAAPDPEQVEIRGADPILPTRFRVGEAAAVCGWGSGPWWCSR